MFVMTRIVSDKATLGWKEWWAGGAPPGPTQRIKHHTYNQQHLRPRGWQSFSGAGSDKGGDLLESPWKEGPSQETVGPPGVYSTPRVLKIPTLKAPILPRDSKHNGARHTGAWEEEPREPPRPRLANCHHPRVKT
jgi:hypothetical protein